MDDNTNKEEGIDGCDYALCLILLLMDKTNRIEERKKTNQKEKVHEMIDIFEYICFYI